MIEFMKIMYNIELFLNNTNFVQIHFQINLSIFVRIKLNSDP